MPTRFPPSSLARCLLALVVAVASVARGAETEDTGDSSPRRTPIVRAVERARATVVNIHGRKSLPNDAAPSGSADQFRQVNGMGTGVIIDERGYVLTNYHVVEGVGRIQVTLADQKTLTAQLTNHDPTTDLAIIKLSADGPFPVIDVGSSFDLMTGEPVIAVGNAYGYEHTVTRGIVSAQHRNVRISDQQEYLNLIQTDASINPGNSGGPLLNIEGKMIGINVAVRVGAQGIGFAIPVDDAMDVASRLLASEHASGVWHGVEGQTVNDTKGSRYVVCSVQSGSPAERSGLRAGDVIHGSGGRMVYRALDLDRLLLGRKPGDTISLSVRRDKEDLDVSLSLVESRALDSPVVERAWQLLGIRLKPVPMREFRELTSRYRGGLRVASVRPDSPAASQGIRSGDILVGMHKWETISLDNIAYILGSPEFLDNQPTKFYILRGSDTLYGHLQVSAVQSPEKR